MIEQLEQIFCYNRFIYNEILKLLDDDSLVVLINTNKYHYKKRKLYYNIILSRPFEVIYNMNIQLVFNNIEFRKLVSKFLKNHDKHHYEEDILTILSKRRLYY